MATMARECAQVRAVTSSPEERGANFAWGSVAGKIGTESVLVRTREPKR